MMTPSSLRRRLLSTSLLTGLIRRPLARGLLSSAAGLASSGVPAAGEASGGGTASTGSAPRGQGAGRGALPVSDPAARPARPAGDTGAQAAASGPQVPTLTSLPGLASSFALDFDVYYTGSGMKGLRVAHATYRFSRKGERYQLSTEARATGVLAVFYSGTLNQNSAGMLGNRGFQPQRYTEKRGKRPERRFEFDAARRQVRLDGDAAHGYPYPDGTQDRLSIFFQLGLLARNGRPALQQGRKFVLPLAGNHRVDEPFLQVIGNESLKTGAGTLDALHISVSKPDDPEAPRFDVWLAPALKMLPVRIRVFEKNDSTIVDQLLSKMPEGV